MALIRDILAFLALAISAAGLYAPRQYCEKDWCEGLTGSQTDVCNECVANADKLPLGKDTAKEKCKALAATPALLQEAAQVQKRASRPAADRMPDVSPTAASQHSGVAMQPQKSAAGVSSHEGARARRKFYVLDEAAQVQERASQPAADSMLDVSSKATSQHSGVAAQAQKSAAVVSSHGGARARRTFYEQMEATSQHGGVAVQPQKSAAAVASHGHARARRTFYAEMEAMEEREKAAVSKHRRENNRH